MRLRSLLCCGVVGLLALTACSGAPEPAPTAAPTTPPAATPAAPEPTEEPTEAPVEPISVVVGYVEGQPLDNAGLRGEEVRFGDQAALDGAVEAARAALERYLQAQFIDPATRFGPAPVEALLTPTALAALPDDQRPALGELDLDVVRTSGGQAPAEALILMDGADVLGLNLHYTSTVHVEAADGATGTLTQRGDLWFAETDEGWRAEVVDLTLDEPELGGR